MLCFLKIQLGDKHEKTLTQFVWYKVTYYKCCHYVFSTVQVVFFLFIAVYIFRLAHRANA